MILIEAKSFEMSVVVEVMPTVGISSKLCYRFVMYMILIAGNLLCAGKKTLNLTNVYVCLPEMELGEEHWRLLPQQITSTSRSSSIRTAAASSATTTTSEAFQPILGI